MQTKDLFVIGKFQTAKKVTLRENVVFYEMIINISETEIPNWIKFEVWKKDLITRMQKNYYRVYDAIQVRFELKGNFNDKTKNYYVKLRANDIVPFRDNQ